MTNPTALAFGHPGSKIAEIDHGLILDRSWQPTFGSLVLVCKEAVKTFSALSPVAFAGLRIAVAGLGRSLKDRVGYRKINSLMRMMVDNQVLFHRPSREARLAQSWSHA